jgi:hypothetical protein
MLRDPPAEEQLCQSMHHGIMSELPPHINRKTFPAVLIKYRKHTECSPISRAVIHKVIAPYMILILRTKPNT